VRRRLGLLSYVLFMTEDQVLISSVQEKYQVVILFSFRLLVRRDLEDIGGALMELGGYSGA